MLNLCWLVVFAEEMMLEMSLRDEQELENKGVEDSISEGGNDMGQTQRHEIA